MRFAAARAGIRRQRPTPAATSGFGPASTTARVKVGPRRLSSNSSLSALEPPLTPFLYKYGSAEHLEWLQSILLHHRVYFPSPAELKDPLDARPRFTILNREGALRFILNTFLAANAHEPPNVLAAHVPRITHMVMTGPLDRLAATATRLFRRQMDGHRIYSMTTRPDNEHLWEHYAGAHTGYCLEFHNRGVFAYARKVIYGDAVELDLGDPSSIDATFLFRKTMNYQDEEEVRILAFPRGGPHEIQFDPPTLERVILGKRMSDAHCRRIREWCATRKPVLRAEQHLGAPRGY